MTKFFLFAVALAALTGGAGADVPSKGVKPGASVVLAKGFNFDGPSCDTMVPSFRTAGSSLGTLRFSVARKTITDVKNPIHYKCLGKKGAHVSLIFKANRDAFGIDGFTVRSTFDGKSFSSQGRRSSFFKVRVSSDAP